jgi:cytochrome c-L
MLRMFNLVAIAGLGLVFGVYQSAHAELVFRDTITGNALDLSLVKPGPDTEAVKHFKETGENKYLGDADAAKQGGEIFLTACSGCHGHEAEGKLGPALRDDYWTYPKNKTDKGLFETIYNGANSMMGPQHKQLTIDEMLHIISWIRSVYIGDPAKAEWLPPDERTAAQAPPATAH